MDEIEVFLRRHLQGINENDFHTLLDKLNASNQRRKRWLELEPV